MKFLLFFPFCFITTFSFAQRLSAKQKADSLTIAKNNIVNNFLRLSPDDRIADIGTGTGYNLIPIANYCNTCQFVAEDIDSLSCNKQALTKQINKTGKKTHIDNFTFHYGTEKSTTLPAATFTKVLVFDVIHELTYKTEMLADIKSILTADGSLFIEEILVHRPVKKDKICNYPFLTEVTFKQLLADNHFSIIKEAVTYDTGKNKYIKIFECAPIR